MSHPRDLRLSDRICARIASRAAMTDPEAGMTTSEYAVGTVAACGAAGILVTFMKSEAFQDILKELVMKSLRKWLHF